MTEHQPDLIPPEELDGTLLEIVKAAEGLTLTLTLIAAWAAQSLGHELEHRQVRAALQRLMDAGVVSKRTAKHRRFYLEIPR